MSYTVRSERVPAMPIAVVRRRAAFGRLGPVVQEACGTVWKAVKAAGVKGAGRHVSVYLDCTGGQVEMEVGVEMPAPIGTHGEVFDSTTPAGEVATVTHLGPYGGLANAHQALRDWCAANGRTATGVNWEVYGHWLPEWNEDPSKIRTDVYYLLG
jgi:effector-binding domain-containing protein